MIAINKEGIFIDGVLTTNPELIGLAMLDFQETCKELSSTITLKEGSFTASENDFNQRDISGFTHSNQCCYGGQ